MAWRIWPARCWRIPRVRERPVGLGMVPVCGPPSVFKTFLDQESARWTALIKAADIKSE